MDATSCYLFWMQSFPGPAGALQRSGIVFHWKENVQTCIPLEAGTVRLELSSGAVLTVDAVLVAAGRQSNTAMLKLEKAGVTLGGRGIIPVNEHFQTNLENIYAAGDVIGFPALYSTSAEQPRRAVHHALGLGTSAIPALLPIGLYTIPEVSMVGETEESLKQKGIARPKQTIYQQRRDNAEENFLRSVEAGLPRLCRIRNPRASNS